MLIKCNQISHNNYFTNTIFPLTIKLGGGAFPPYLFHQHYFTASAKPLRVQSVDIHPRRQI
jgi:hypothetical protein